ncbi:MAG: hypothetical protein RLZZ546_1254 [Bacteroidota bacterium]|jgi:type IX secretion system PorP/SprF family membrane protein
MLRQTFRYMLLFCFPLMMTIEGMSQGIHFSYIEFAPQFVNPGLIGGFKGTYRGTALYRDQWNRSNQSGFLAGYKTIEVGLDIPVINGFRRQDWIGAGLSFNSDTRGSIALKSSLSRLGVSYHLGLDKKQNSIVTIGFQMMNESKTIKTPDRFKSPESIKSGSDPNLQQILNQLQDNGTSLRDFSLGVAFTSRTKTNVLQAGLSMQSLFTPRSAFKSSFDQPTKFIGFLTLNNQISKTLSIEPAALFQLSGFGNEFMANAKVGYKFKKDSNDKIKAGIGFRTGTFSSIFLIGGEIKGINVGLSYDLPLSGFANAPGVQSTFELGATYIGFLKKTPKTKPIILCPRL